MSVRKWYLNEALVSHRRLLKVINDLTAEEIIACLDLETASQRRRSVTDKLIQRAVRLNELAFNQKLQDKYHG